MNNNFCRGHFFTVLGLRHYKCWANNSIFRTDTLEDGDLCPSCKRKIGKTLVGDVKVRTIHQVYIQNENENVVAGWIDMVDVERWEKDEEDSPEPHIPEDEELASIIQAIGPESVKRFLEDWPYRINQQIQHDCQMEEEGISSTKALPELHYRLSFYSEEKIRETLQKITEDSMSEPEDNPLERGIEEAFSNAPFHVSIVGAVKDSVNMWAENRMRYWAIRYPNRTTEEEPKDITLARMWLRANWGERMEAVYNLLQEWGMDLEDRESKSQNCPNCGHP